MAPVYSQKRDIPACQISGRLDQGAVSANGYHTFCILRNQLRRRMLSVFIMLSQGEKTALSPSFFQAFPDIRPGFRNKLFRQIGNQKKSFHLPLTAISYERSRV